MVDHYQHFGGICHLHLQGKRVQGEGEMEKRL
jgi:hypothetical protein